MKTKLILILIACLFVRRSPAQTIVPINSGKSLINWTGHAEVGTYSPAGTLNLKDGNITVKGSNIISAILTVDMNTMKQDNEHLLEHLKSEDFFDVKKYPVSTIKIDKILDGVAFGKLTIKNITLPFQCPVSVDSKGNIKTIRGKTVIDRTKYGIIYNSGNFFSDLGDKAIRNTFEVEFTISITLPG